MPTKQLENELKATVDIRASLEQKREGIVNALKGAPNKQAQERQDLQKKHDQILGGSAIAHDQRVISVLSGQRSQLELSQKNQLELINKALDAAARIEKSGTEGPRQALQFLNNAADLNGSLAESNKQRQAAEINQLKTMLANNNAEQRNEQLNDLSQSQKQAAELLDRDTKVATAAIQRREALVENLLDKDDRDRLRAIAMAATKNEKVRGLFSDEVVQRLANEALRPGKERLEQIDESSASQRVKGELAEQIAAGNALDEIKRENLTRSEDHKLFFIAGDRIRDEQGKKLTDGLIVWRDEQRRLQIWKALEVKAGPASARELNRKIEELTQEQDRELRNYALDLARDELAKKNGLTSQELRTETERLAREHEADLRSYAVQKEAGQREQTTERLDLAEKIYVDGQAQQVKVDRERRLSDIVKKVTTDEALTRDLDVQRLGTLSRDLDVIAKAFVEELLRQREKV